MQILDGKNHQHGAFEKIALDRIIGLLNSGKYWGWLDAPITAKNYAPEAILAADATFLATLRTLVDRWIDSGINEDCIEKPSARYVRPASERHSESLFDILYGW